MKMSASANSSAVGNCLYLRKSGSRKIWHVFFLKSELEEGLGLLAGFERDQEEPAVYGIIDHLKRNKKPLWFIHPQ